jgi:hypothetical protein
MGEKVFLLASPPAVSDAPSQLVWLEQKSLELGFMLDKPAWDRKKRPIRSNYKTSLLPDKPAAGVEVCKIRSVTVSES